MKKCRLLAFAILALALPAAAQFLGYTGAQSVRVVALSAVSAPVASASVQNIGQASHTLTYCISGGTATSNAIQLEASVDGITFFAITNPGVNLSGCSVLTAGGWFPVLRVNLVTFTAGGGITLTATYTGIAAPGVAGGGAVLPTPIAIGSSGPANPVVCDKTVTFHAVGAVNQLLISPPGNQGVSLCGGVISYDNTPGVGAGLIMTAGTGATCGTGTVTIWRAYAGTVNQPLQIAPGGGGSFVRVPVGVNVCLNNGTAVNLDITISYAQF